MTKLLGSLCILCAAFAGLWSQRAEGRRWRQTRLDILAALRQMGEEIRLARTTLPLLLEHAAEGCGAEGGAFFRSVAAAAKRGEDLPAAWDQAVQALQLEAEERRALSELGRSFGGDEESLCRAIAIAAVVLQRRAEEAESHRGEEEKRTAALWASGGALLVILLI